MSASHPRLQCACSNGIFELKTVGRPSFGTIRELLIREARWLSNFCTKFKSWPEERQLQFIEDSKVNYLRSIPDVGLRMKLQHHETQFEYAISLLWAIGSRDKKAKELASALSAVLGESDILKCLEIITRIK